MQLPSSPVDEPRDPYELLVRFAEASAKLLDAERASIFLWDKTTHTLVGRPALGVEGGELPYQPWADR